MIRVRIPIRLGFELPAAIHPAAIHPCWIAARIAVSLQQQPSMDHSFSVVVEHNGRSYRVERPALRRDPRAGVRDSMGRLVRYGYLLPGPKRARVAAASTEAIQRLLPEVRAGDASQTECAVCLQDYAAEETIRAMPVCAHAFHHHCISEWLSRKAVCPICRRELPLPTQQDQDQAQEEEQQQEQEDDEEDEYGIRRSRGWIRVPVSAPAGLNW